MVFTLRMNKVVVSVELFWHLAHQVCHYFEQGTVGLAYTILLSSFCNFQLIVMHIALKYITEMNGSRSNFLTSGLLTPPHVIFRGATGI